MVVGLVSFTAYPYSVIPCALGLNHGLQSARALCLFGRDKPPIGSCAGWRSAALRLYHIQRPVVLRKKSTTELHKSATVQIRAWKWKCEKKSICRKSSAKPADVPFYGVKNGKKTGSMFNIAARNADEIRILRRTHLEKSSFGKIVLPK